MPLLLAVIYQWIDHYVNHYLRTLHGKAQMINSDYSKKTGKVLTSSYE